MKLERYNLKENANKMAFEFISEGPKGRILKGVFYTKLKIKSVKNLYNLAFGDKIMPSGKINDRVVTDNQDRDKVLATVVETIVIFTNVYPKAKIYIEGSNDARTRLYQIAISKYLDEFTEFFVIKGYIDEKWCPFEKNVHYEAFKITRK